MNIGIDHGYYAVKTRHFSFPAGIFPYRYEPYTLQNVLEYGESYMSAEQGGSSSSGAKRKTTGITCSRWRRLQRKSKRAEKTPQIVLLSLRQDCLSPISGGKRKRSRNICSETPSL